MIDYYFSAKNIYKKWDSFSLNLSFFVPKGTMTTIVGPSGSGKSTALRLIAGLDFFSKGQTPEIILDGINITNLTPRKRDIGMVFQNFALFSHLRIDDNVGYGLRCSGISKKESRIHATEYLKKFNLEGISKRYPETLSGGEKQRVSLARTLIMKPKLILFDEPLSALDAPLRKKLAKDIRILQKEIGFTGIMVTHDIQEAQKMSDKIILLENGLKKWEGNPLDFNESLF